MGWLHWSEEQLYAADINAILIGVEGQQDWLRFIFGPGEPSSVEAARPPALTPERFDKLFGGGKRK